MQITREQLFCRMEELHAELYHSGQNYIASIAGGGVNGKYNECYYNITNILPKDKNENKILNLASIMIMFMSEDKELIHSCKGLDGFTCSLTYRKGDNFYSEYIFITKRNAQVSQEEIICKKYHIEPTIENQKKIKVSIDRRVYSYRMRDLEKKKRCINFEDAAKLEDYLLNTEYFDIRNEDNELQKLKYLSGKRVSELTSDQKKELSNYIATTLRPILLYKAPSDSKLLVNDLPEFKSASYKELCDVLINNKDECSYCNCKMSLLNAKYTEIGLTFDAIISLYGHRKDNIAICCSLCNSKKNFKNKLDSSNEN